MLPPAIGICIPNNSRLDLGTIEAHVNDCTCRRRNPLYQVLCGFHKVPDGYEPEERAIACAHAALKQFENAIIGVGFERGQKVFYHNSRPIITPVAAAVVIIRKKPEDVCMIVATHNDASDYSKQLFELCRSQGFTPAPQGRGSVMDRVIRQALFA